MSVFECPFSYYERRDSRLVALAFSKEVWTYKKCNQIIENACHVLKYQGVKPGDRIAFISASLPIEPLFLFALFRLKAIACPLSSRLPLERVPILLDLLTSTYFFYPDKIKSDLPPIKQISFPFSFLLKTTKKGRPTPHFLQKSNHATYLFTSGTTSTPKIVCHSLSNHYYSALGSNAHIRLSSRHRSALSLPLYHIAGIALLFRSFLAGGAVVLAHGKPHLAENLLKTRATHVSLVATQLYHLLENATDKEILKLGNQLKSILVGGGPLSYAIYRKSQEWGLPLFSSYGMTEMSSQISTELAERPAFSLGHPLLYREMMIDEKKEIHVRGKTLFQGYLNQKIRLPLSQEGYFPTGDLGTYSPKTGLRLIGRKDRLFISGGENIYPEEIEYHLRGLEGIIDVRIEPKEDRALGMRPVAYIQSKEPFHQRGLEEYLKTFLPSFKIPKTFYLFRGGRKD